MKNTLIINGGKKLSGAITPQGAKNEALQVLCAVLLTDKDVVIKNVPQILDVLNLIKILEVLGVAVKDLGNKSYSFNAANVDPEKVYTDEYRDLASRLRGSLMLVGATLARFGVGYVPEPGGDKIGTRSISGHIFGFRELGATTDGSLIHLSRVEHEKEIEFDKPSVTGTANVILASVLKKGTKPHRVTLYNVACEPYIQQLCRMLNSMGAKISGARTNLLTIEGVSNLNGTVHVIDPDMIEIGSLVSLAAVIGDGVLIKDAKPIHLGFTACKVFKKLGVNLQQREGGIFIPRHDSFSIQSPFNQKDPIRLIHDNPWPGLSPDHISCLITMATHAHGQVIVQQRMFEDRLGFCETLVSMGCQIKVFGKQEALIIGNDRRFELNPIHMSSPDIRAGMALLIAALSADGQSIINNAKQIHRGYENIVERLNALGADIQEAD